MTALSPELVELADDFPAELVGINEFAELVGFNASATAQVRAERKRDNTDFPAVVSESGRSFLHRIDHLIHWLERSRFITFVSARDDRVAAWRLERRVLALVEEVGVMPARRLLAALAICGEDVDRSSPDTLSAMRDLGDGLVQELLADLSVAPRLVRPLGTELERSSLTPAVVDQVLVAIGSHQPGVPHRTAAGLAGLVAFVLDAGAGHTVYEPTSGECEVLLRVARLAQERDAPLDAVHGHDSDPETLLIGMSRLRLAGVDAQVGAAVAPGSVDRMVIDTGSAPSRRDLARWLRLLHRDGRVVIVTQLTDTDTTLLADAPPEAIILPPQRSRRSGPVTALWISTPFGEAKQNCTVIDLRSPRRDDQVDGNRIDALATALQLGQPDSMLANDAAWEPLRNLIPLDLHVSVIPTDEIGGRLADAIEGTLGFSKDVVAANQTYAAALASELERLIGGHDVATTAEPISRPLESPDGILATQASEEALRVITRLAASLQSGRRTRNTS